MFNSFDLCLAEEEIGSYRAGGVGIAGWSPERNRH